MVLPEDAVIIDRKKYVENGGVIKYPFPIEDFAIKTFGLDIQYEDFYHVFSKDMYEPSELFGCLFPDNRFFQGIDKVILLNTSRKAFILAGQEVNRAYWEDYAERQTIAHEVGHYSDKYCHNHKEHKEVSQLDLFLPTVIIDAGSSIIVYPVGEETFANKYARCLLMPEDKVREFITKNGVAGTFDLNSLINKLKENFGVTQFMIEIRLYELGIHFYNGVYIKHQNRFPYMVYTESSLLILIDIVKKYALRHPLYDADNFVKEYNLLTNETRASAALFFAFNRILQGKYDKKYPSVFEKRVIELAEFNPDRLQPVAMSEEQ